MFGALTDVEEACSAAGFDDVLADLPHGMDTVLGRGGVGLSLAQAATAARPGPCAGLHAPVLLLDEPTAHLDPATEATVLRAIAERAAAGTTVVMVGHRNSVLAIADQVIVVEADHDVAV